MNQNTISSRLMFQPKLKFKRKWTTYYKIKLSHQHLFLLLVLTTNEIRRKRERTNAEFLKESLLLNKDQLDASNKAADQKNKKIIKDIIDPTPGLFIDDKLNANDQIFKNTTDNVFNLPP